MTRVEAIKIVAMLETNWQPFKDTNAAIDLWASAFTEDPYELVNTAVMSLIQTDTNEFRPNIAKVRKEMREIIYGEKISEAEAWIAVKNSLPEAQESPETLKGAKSAWSKLPEDIQKLVTPQQLLDYNSVETSTLDTVIQSNFMRSYREVSDRRYKKEVLPKEMLKTISAIREVTGLYKDPEKKPELPQPKKVAYEKPDWMVRREANGEKFG